MYTFETERVQAVIMKMPVWSTRDEIIDKLNEISEEETARACIQIEIEEERKISRTKRYFDSDNKYDEMKDHLATNEGEPWNKQYKSSLLWQWSEKLCNCIK